MDDASYRLPSDNHEWQAFREWIVERVQYDGKTWIPYSVAEEIADETCVRVDQRYDPTKGASIFTFAGRIYKNLLRDAYREHFRDRAVFVSVEEYQEAEDADSSLNQPPSSELWSNTWNERDKRATEIRDFELMSVNTPEEELDAVEALEWLDQALEALPKGQELAFRLWMQGMEKEAIAFELKRSVETVKSNISRAKNALHKQWNAQARNESPIVA